MAKTRGQAFDWRQVRVGVVLIVGLALIAFATARIGQILDVFADRYPLFTLVESAAGLQDGSPVHLAGQRVGQVDEVEFLPPEMRTDEYNLILRLSVDVEVAEQIRRDSRAQILSLGLLGDRYINIEPGSPRMPILDPGDTIPSAGAAGLDEMLTAGATALDTAMLLISDLREVTRSIAAGEGTLGRLITDEELYAQMVVATTQLRTLLAEVNRQEGTLGRLIRDPELYERLSAVALTVDTLTLRLTRGEGSLGRFIRSDTLYERFLSTVISADSAAENLAALTEMMVEGRGTFRRIFTDPALYDEVLKAVVDLQTLIAAIRQNPRLIAPDVRVDIF